MNKDFKIYKSQRHHKKIYRHLTYKDFKQFQLTNAGRIIVIIKIFETDNNFHVALITCRIIHYLLIADLIRILTNEIRMRTIKKMLSLNNLQELEIAHKYLLDAVKKSNATLFREMIVDEYFYSYDVVL